MYIYRLEGCSTGVANWPLTDPSIKDFYTGYTSINKVDNLVLKKQTCKALNIKFTKWLRKV